MNIKDEYKEYIDPVTYFNKHGVDRAKELIEHKHNKDKLTYDCFFDEKGVLKNGANKILVSYKNGLFFSRKYSPLPEDEEFTPFQVLNYLKYNNNYYASINYVNKMILNKPLDIIRVGIDYFKIIDKPDRFNIERTELKRWNKQELKDDIPKDLMKFIQKFDDFAIVPDNLDYKPVITSKKNLYYNLYAKFSHTPKQGSWDWTERFLKHIFGDQYKLGIIYMQVLYLYPKQVLPILVLSSKERQTGKSTFIDWLNLIFGANMSVINPEDIAGNFNGSYSQSNIIAIEETLIEKKASAEKIKALATQKFISVNKKFIDNYKLPFFGKIILCTNNETDFAKIDDEEIRFWVRKLGSIPKDNENHNILYELQQEISAFLYYLTTLQKPDFTRSRMVFTASDIKTYELQRVVSDSRSTLHKELEIIFQDLFSEFQNELKEKLCFSVSEIKTKFFYNNSQISMSYIKKVLINEMNIEYTENGRYTNLQNESKVSNHYTIYREKYVDIPLENDDFVENLSTPPF